MKQEPNLWSVDYIANKGISILDNVFSLLFFFILVRVV